MKTRLLKKIRKRYRWYYSAETVVTPLVVMDMKKQRVDYYWEAKNFIIKYCYEHLGFWTGTNYQQRKQKIRALKHFRTELKKAIRP
jgi:hypothetical protein